MWFEARQTLLDLFFPPRCAACGECAWGDQLGQLCRDCRRRLPRPGPRCGACGRLAGPHGPPLGCERCTGILAERDALRWSGRASSLDRRPLRGVIAPWAYAGSARDLVLALKFRGRPEAARALGRALAEEVFWADVPGDLIVPVPLSARRRRQRGFNQAELLAVILASTTGLQLCPAALRRHRDGPPQSGRSRTARRSGPRGAFQARVDRVAGRCVLLVDDVLTSGATARACALALRKAGALSVTAAVACRAEPR